MWSAWRKLKIVFFLTHLIIFPWKFSPIVTSLGGVCLYPGRPHIRNSNSLDWSTNLMWASLPRCVMSTLSTWAIVVLSPMSVILSPVSLITDYTNKYLSPLFKINQDKMKLHPKLRPCSHVTLNIEQIPSLSQRCHPWHRIIIIAWPEFSAQRTCFSDGGHSVGKRSPKCWMAP